MFFCNINSFKILIRDSVLSNELLKIDINEILVKNRNIPEPIILAALQKLFRKRLCSDLNFLKIFEREKIVYKKQRNVCASLLHKTKRDYVANLDTKTAKDNRKF